MKKIITIIAILISYTGFAQVGIGNIDPQATLDISAKAIPDNTDGILIPRMDNFPTPAPTAAQDGMMIFVTGAGTPTKGFYYWDSTAGPAAWVAITSNGGGTLDEAYDFGGTGVGRIITADNGAVEIQGNGGLRVEDDIIAAESIVHDADTNTFIQFTPDRIQLDAGGRNYIDIQHASQEIAFNEDSTETDVRVESGNETHMLFVDGSEDRVGINRNNPQATLQIDGNMDGDGSAIIVNAGDTQNGMEMNLSGTSATNIDNVDGIDISHNVDFTGTGARPSGLSVTMNGSSTDAGSSVRGLSVSINGPSNYLGNVYGSYIQELSTADSRLYGYFFSGGGAGINSVYGSYNTISGAGTGAVYGNFNLMSGLGTGTKYGSYNNIGSTAGGTHYGVYSDVRKTNSYAGFFIGRTSFGTDGVLNRYIMPAVDGTAGQVMTTNGAGQLSFSTLAAGIEKIDDLTDGKSDSDGSDDGSSIFLGVNAGAADDSSSNGNVGIGYESMLTNTTGNFNNAIGWGSLRGNDDGSSNTAMGYLSLSGNTSGDSNTAVGMRTLLGNGANDNNTAIGADAMYVSTGANNVAVGRLSLFSFNGSNNTAIGLSAGEVSGGDNNVFIGHMAGSGSTIANNRLFIENTNADPENALIYGEFGVDATTTGNILRTNSQFQIGNPTGTGFAFPGVDGTSGQVLTTDGAGQLSFISPAPGGVTLDEAYDFGGAGTGRTITADNGAVEIQGGGGLRVESDITAGNSIIHDGDTNTLMQFTPDRIQFGAGGRNYIDIQHANQEIAFNEDSTESDFRIESGTEANMFFVDGSENHIGIGTNSPATALHIDVTTPFDLEHLNIGQDDIFLSGGGLNAADAVGASIGFGGTSNRAQNRRAAISSVQTGGDVDFTGLAFYTHGNPVNQTPMLERMRLNHSGNLGINTTDPSATLDVVGTMQFEDGNEAAGFVLTSDAAGNASWAEITSPTSSYSLAKITNNISQTLTGAYTKVNFDTVDFDINTEFDSTLDRFIVDNDGYYEIKSDLGLISTAASGTLITIRIQIYINGTAVKSSTEQFDAGIISHTISISSIENLNSNDFIEIYAINAGGSATVQSGLLDTTFEVKRIR